MDRQGFQEWLDRYVAAWKSYDEQRSGALQRRRVDRTAPTPTSRTSTRAGRRSPSWLDDKDEPDTYDAKYEPLAIDGNTHVASGLTKYFNAGRLAARRVLQRLHLPLQR